MNAEALSNKLLTLADWAALPEDKLHHYELARGVLEVNAKPAPRHQLTMADLLVQLRDQLPDGLVVVPDVDVIVADGVYPTVRAPDLCVVPLDVVHTEPARFRAADVQLTVEILSPSALHTDREIKFFEYADAGISHHWIVDLETPPTIIAYQLMDGDYELMAQGAEITLNTPVPLTIELAES